MKRVLWLLHFALLCVLCISAFIPFNTSKPHVFRADFQTFILIFPDDGGVMIE